MKSYFEINDLPNGTWSVTWPVHIYDVINNPAKALTLLEIMFEHVGVEEAMIGVQENGHDNDWQTLHFSSEIWWMDNDSREYMARRMTSYVIPGVRFRDQYEAEKFKLHMEQRLAWRILGGKWS